MTQNKAVDYWSLKKGDELKGKKIINIRFFEDSYDGNHLKIIQLADGTEYFLDNAGLRKIETPK